MSSFDGLGRWLIIVGLGIAAAGLLIFLAGKIPFFQQLGHLPGDLRFGSADGRISCFVPIVTSLLLSLILTILLNIIARLFQR